MIDLQILHTQPERVREAVRQKKADVDVDALLVLDEQRRDLQRRIEEVAHEQNTIARELGNVLSTGAAGADPDLLKERGRELKQAHAHLALEVDGVQHTFADLLERVPNFPTEDTPVGKGAEDNRVLREVGELPAFSFAPKEHWEIGSHLGIIDTERAAKVSGSRFSYLVGDAALLEFALVQFAVSLLTNPEALERIALQVKLTVPSCPFVPVIPPTLIRSGPFRRMARLEPREERYHIPTDDLYLVGSAEHTLGAMHMDETFREESLPRRYVGFSVSYRREAGSYGKDVHGILRVHQFDKLEMESFTIPEASRAEQDFLVAIQEHLMAALGIPYRVVLMCTGDMGGPDARQVDIEAWFPGQNRYRETHSADLMTDYQARRLQTKVRRAHGRSEYVHMNDATAFAIGRTIAAILENFQEEDGSVRIPEVLRPFLGGRDRVLPVT